MNICNVAKMSIKEKKWYQYLEVNGHKFALWFVFFFVTALSIWLTMRIISDIKEKEKAPQRSEEVKIYFQKSVPDSLLNILKNDIDGIQATLESMQQDSIAVSVQKVAR